MFNFNIRSSFTSRLIVGSLIALLLLSIPVVLTAHWILRDNTINQAGLTAQAQTEQIAQSVDSHLTEHLRDLVYTSRIEQSFGDYSTEQQTKLLQIMREHTPGYLWIGVAAVDGTVLAALDDLLVGKSVAARPWFKQGLIAPAIMDVHEAALLAALLPSRAEEKYQFIDFTTPLRNQQEEVIGVIGIHLDWKYFISQIEQDVFNRINPSAPTVILTKDGALRMGNRLDRADFQDSTAWTAMEGFQKAVAGQSNWSIETLSDGEDYLIAFAPNNSADTASLGWISATVTPLDAVSSPISQALLGAIFALIIGTAATLLLVLALGRSLSAKASAYLNQVRKNDPEALERTMRELPTELQPISRDILDLTRGLTEKSLSLEKALRSAKESYWVVEALIVQAPIPIAMFDQDMNYVAASSRWVQTFTQAKGSLVGKNHYEVVPNLNERWRQAHRAGLAGESVSATSDPWVNADGSTIWLDWAIEPWLRPDGNRGGIILMCKDVTEERLMRDSLAESEERFKLAMEGSHDGLWDWHVGTDKVYFSPSWKRLLGYEDHELTNDFGTWERLTAPDDLELAKKALHDALNNPEKDSYEAEFRMAHRRGHWVHILAKALIVRDEEDRPTRVVGTHLDRTVQLELESRLRETAIAAKAEKDSNAEKSRFLATMSHEIRTPLNGIMGFARLLEMDLPDGEMKEQAGHLVQSSETLSAILNDILDFSKLESGMVKIIDSPFLMDQLLKGSSELPRLTCESKGVKFELHNNLGEQQIYSGDMGRLRQILQNLLSNAIKFTSHGKVSLKVSSTPVNADQDMLTFEVSDTGLGIPKDKQHQLFKPFSQVHTDRENRYGGTGLGLSIVKSLITAMGGEIQLDSEPGKGTQVVFSVTLKREQVLTSLSAERILPTRSLHVLVADDTPLNIKLIETFLKKDGHTVSVAKNGAEALKIALSEPVDFILLDIDMPKLNGYEVAEQIRATDGPNQAREIAALTGYAFDSDIQKAEEAGFNYHFAKPIQFNLLLNRLALSSQNTK
ncbi:ATP-binding protein [Limnobacter parvus]|uniref:histidine kinase n=1 Tax=Limnobacter parvus TaxID=2939690 RepID=A0ABT1XME0_9BURK|nr:ATP-binding protein [Limnobacter parvus]MCR2747259.1 ATP-binding protein [Limnobacter parvus]